MRNQSRNLTETTHIPDRNFLAGELLAGILLLQFLILFLMLTDKFKVLLVVVLAIAGLILLFRPQLALYLSTFIAYSGIAASVLEGLFLPAAALTTAGLIIQFLNDKHETLTSAPQNKIFLAWGGLMILSTFYARDLTLSYTDLYTFFKYVIFYFLIINILDSWQSLRRMLWLLTITGLLMFLYGIYVFVSSPIEAGLRLTSAITDPNSFAIQLIPLVAFSYTLIKTEMRWFLKILSFVLLGLIVVSIILTFSRGGWLALLATLFLIGLNERTNKKLLFFLAISFLAAIIIIPKDFFLLRFGSVQSITMDASVAQRLRLLKGSFQMFLDHFFTGVGIGNFLAYSKLYAKLNFPLVAHNTYLHVAAELGIVGLILFISLLWVTFQNLRRAAALLLKTSLSKLHHYPKGLMIALAGFAVNALTLSEHLNIALFLIIAFTVVIQKLAQQAHSIND